MGKTPSQVPTRYNILPENFEVYKKRHNIKPFFKEKRITTFADAE